MCWLTPKFEEGNCEKAEMVRSGLSSQSGGGLVGRLEAFEDGDCAGLETLEFEDLEEGELNVFEDAAPEGRSEYPLSFRASGKLCEANSRSRS